MTSESDLEILISGPESIIMLPNVIEKISEAKHFHLVDFKESFIHIHPTNIHLVLAHINRPMLGAVVKPCKCKNRCPQAVCILVKGKMSIPANGMGN